MGCTASKPGASGQREKGSSLHALLPTTRKSEDHLPSWYTPLARSISAPIECNSHGDPAVNGSFVRLLHRRNLLTPSADHNKLHGDHQHQNGFHHAAGHLKLSPSSQNIKKLSRFSHEGGDRNIDPSLQQVQLASLSNSHAHKHLARDFQSLSNEALHDQNAASYDGLSFRFPKKPPLSMGLSSVMENGDDSGDEGDDEGNSDEWDIVEELDDRSKNGFMASRFNGDHASVKKIFDMEKSLSFNTVLDTEIGCPAWPPRWVTQQDGKEKKKKKKSLDVLDPDASVKLDGVEDNIFINGAKEDIIDLPHKLGFPQTESSTTNTTKFTCNVSSAFSEDCFGGSKLNTPLRSPSKSPLLSPKGSICSPLFDPSLLALFEQAAESIRHTAPDDDWMLVDNTNEPSSFSSLDKVTWDSSDISSSDADSPQEKDTYFSNTDDLSFESLPNNEGLHGSNGKQWKLDAVYADSLDLFEFRCPPRGEDKVVLYFTSLRGVRKTHQNCYTIRLILQGLGVEVDERDVWMHFKFREELTDILGHEALPVPRLFIKGRYIGGADEVKQLHEDGVLMQLVKDLPTFGKRRKSCDGCAGVRFIPCLECRGSRKYVDIDSDEVIKCIRCNENGLIMCPLCHS